MKFQIIAQNIIFCRCEFFNNKKTLGFFFYIYTYSINVLFNTKLLLKKFIAGSFSNNINTMKSLAINQSRNKLHFTVFHLCLFPKKKKKTKQRTKIIFQEITNQYKSPAFAQKRIASSPASSHADETRCHSSVRISLLTSGHSCGKPSRPSPTPSVSLFRRRYLRSPLKSCVTKKKHKKNIFFFVGRTFAM